MNEFIKNKLIDSRTLSNINNWYLSHTRRDQLTIQTVSALVVISLFWTIIFQPLLDWHNQQKDNERSTYALLSTIKNNANELVKLKTNSNGVSTNNKAIIPIITKTANLNKIQLSRLQPGSDDAVVVYLEKQGSSSVLKWVVQLKENNKIHINSINIESEEANGLVSAQISFYR